MSSSISNHCPLLLTPLPIPVVRPKFRFERYMVDMPGFQDCVKGAWEKPVDNSYNPLTTLHIKLSRTTKAPKSWAKTIKSQRKVAMEICMEAIGQLEKANESKNLSESESAFIRTLKLRLLGFAAIEKSKAKQKSILTWIRLADANTIFPILWPIVGKGRTSSKHWNLRPALQYLRKTSIKWCITTSCNKLAHISQETAS
jgi:hypothetical protein